MNIEKHLQNKQSIHKNSLMEKQLLAQQQSIQDAINSAEFNTLKKRKLIEETPYKKPLDGAMLEALYVRWIASNDQALHLTECLEFRAFLTYLNSNVNAHLPNSHTTYKAWVLNQYEIEKDRIWLQLHTSPFKIHICHGLD
jgi:hypothetical protein